MIQLASCPEGNELRYVMESVQMDRWMWKGDTGLAG